MRSFFFLTLLSWIPIFFFSSVVVVGVLAGETVQTIFESSLSEKLH